MYISSSDSTNRLLKAKLREKFLPEGFVVRTDFQESGRGQGSNSWESEKGKNLLFSILLRPDHIPVGSQFLISQMVALAALNALQQMAPDEASAFTVKWPNDIYWNNKKIGGILIEHILQGNVITATIAGIGLNVNQQVFRSDAPNPVSLRMITGRTHRRKLLLELFKFHFFRLYTDDSDEQIRSAYDRSMYRRLGFHSFYSEEKGSFEAAIDRVENDGRLVVKEKTGQESGFYFKEVVFC